jgi:hypothetical protein
MTDVATEISPLALSILALLDERPMHPYELAGMMRNRHHDEFVRLNFGSLYHTVDVLERDGWIVPVERLMHMHHLSAAKAASLLGERVQGLAAKIEHLTHILGDLRAEGVSRLALIELEHKISVLEAERTWVRKVEREITEGKLEWKVGIDPDYEKLRTKHGQATH